MRLPQELDAAIEAHRAKFGSDPKLISINAAYKELHKVYFSGRIHQLCCGKGYLYSGVPCIITPSVFVDDFLIGY